MGEKFRTKLGIAYEEIIELLKVPNGTELYIVFDSWWYSSDFIGKIKGLSHETICRLKSNKKTVVNGEEKKVRDFAEGLDFDETVVKVRGKKKRYLASEHIVEISKLGEVKLVVSKKEGKDPHYLISTDLDLSSKEIVEIYEERKIVGSAKRQLPSEEGLVEDSEDSLPGVFSPRHDWNRVSLLFANNLFFAFSSFCKELVGGLLLSCLGYSQRN